MKKNGTLFIFTLFITIMFFCCPVYLQAQEDKPDACWSNWSNIKCSSADGCNAQAVYEKCAFFINFWNPNGNLGLKTISVTIKKNGTTVVSKSANVSNNYGSILLSLDEKGSYTVERSATTSSGDTLTWDDATLNLQALEDCGAGLKVSSSNISLSMTGTKTYMLTVTGTGPVPANHGFTITSASSNLSYEWQTDSWHDTTGDGINESAKLEITAEGGGKGTIAIAYKEGTTDTTLATKTVTVTVGPQYTISYNANGGSGAPSSQTKYYGKTLTLSSIKPTRTGYDFVGWGTSSSSTSASYQPGGSYTSNSSRTLYAVWKLKEYTISYNANGGSGAPSSQTKYYGKTLTLSSTKPTRTGYDFVGWGLSSSSTSASYQSGGTYTSNSSRTLYAVWKLKEYTISYNMNGGSGGPSSQTKYYGKTLTLSSTKPTRIGYDFVGWGISSSSTSASYQPGGSYTSNSSRTLYAVWKPKIFYVNYDTNGGSGAPSSQTKYYGKTLTLSSTKPTRTGYDFVGWGTSSSSTSASYQPGGSYTENADITLYAVWEKQNITESDTSNHGDSENILPQSKVDQKYSVEYNFSGLSRGTTYEGLLNKGDTILIPNEVPQRFGYRFVGWRNVYGNKSVLYKPGDKMKLEGNVFFEAEWENMQRLPTVKITKARNIKVKYKGKIQKTIEIKWKKKKGLDGYYIFISNNRDFDNALMKRVGKKKGSYLLTPKKAKQLKRKLKQIKFVKIIGYREINGTTYFTQTTNKSLKKIK